MEKLLTMLLCLSIASCSTLRKTVVYSALSGSLAGVASGAALSPNRDSRGGNMLLFGLGGAALAAGIGYALYQDDPRNYKLKHMLLGEKLDIDLGDLKIAARLDQDQSYRVPLIPLPNKLKDKVSRQYLMQYHSREKFIKKGTKTYYVPSFSVFEHSYGQLGEVNDVK